VKRLPELSDEMRYNLQLPPNKWIAMTRNSREAA
jgi:hypothetical protein